jgi:hypothetical protein
MIGISFGTVQGQDGVNSVDWTLWTGERNGPPVSSPIGTVSKSQLIPVSSTKAVQIVTNGSSVQACVLTINQVFFTGIGSVATGETSLSNLVTAVPLDPTRIFIIYKISTSLRAAVLTVNTTTNTVTFGTPVTVVTTSDTAPTLCILSEDKVLIGYLRNGIVVTIQTGTNVIGTIGSPAVIITPSTTLYSKSLQFIATDKAIVTALYDNGGSGDSGAAIVTVSSTTINAVSFTQFGTLGTFSISNNTIQTVGFSATSILYIGCLTGGSGFGAHILSVSGTSFSAGSLQTLLGGETVGNTSNCSLCLLNPTQAMLIYASNASVDPSQINAVVITSSLTTSTPVPLDFTGGFPSSLNSTSIIDQERIIFSNPNLNDYGSAVLQILFQDSN